MEQKYEYKCVTICGFGKKKTKVLNEYAKEGWEFITATIDWHYFRKML